MLFQLVAFFLALIAYNLGFYVFVACTVSAMALYLYLQSSSIFIVVRNFFASLPLYFSTVSFSLGFGVSRSPLDFLVPSDIGFNKLLLAFLITCCALQLGDQLASKVNISAGKVYVFFSVHSSRIVKYLIPIILLELVGFVLIYYSRGSILSGYRDQHSSPIFGSLNLLISSLLITAYSAVNGQARRLRIVFSFLVFLLIFYLLLTGARLEPISLLFAFLYVKYSLYKYSYPLKSLFYNFIVRPFSRFNASRKGFARLIISATIIFYISLTLTGLGFARNQGIDLSVLIPTNSIQLIIERTSSVLLNDGGDVQFLLYIGTLNAIACSPMVAILGDYKFFTFGSQTFSFLPRLFIPSSISGIKDPHNFAEDFYGLRCGGGYHETAFSFLELSWFGLFLFPFIISFVLSVFHKHFEISDSSSRIPIGSIFLTVGLVRISFYQTFALFRALFLAAALAIALKAVFDVRRRPATSL